MFCLTSLDTATRLARYMFQEFWLKPGEKVSDPTVTGARKVLCNPYVSTAITVVLGIALGMTGYAKIWPLFGAANQLLAGLGLLAVAAWLGKMGRNNKMFIFPMIFMILVTLTSLVFTIKAQIVGIMPAARALPGSTSVVFWLSCWSSLQSTSSSRAARRSRLTARRLSRPNRRTAQNVTPEWRSASAERPFFACGFPFRQRALFIFSCKRRGNMAYCRQHSHGGAAMKRSEQREQNIQRVICVAQSLFIADGIAATPISRIAEAAGLTPTSLYRYFRNKDALVFAAWRDALATFFSDFMAQYTREAASCKNGYEKFVVCMHIYFRTYDRRPEWYDYTREMFSAYSEKGTGNDVNNVFWKYYDREIPVPALKALREGVADGSIRPDVNIYAVYQCLLNAYTGTTIYENLSFGVSPGRGRAIHRRAARQLHQK